MRTTGNPMRGCGGKSSGFYLIGEMSEIGNLSPAVITAGTHLNGDNNNVRFDLAPILTHWIDPSRTIDTGQLFFMESSLADRQEGIYTGAARSQVNKLGMYAVAHHVGSQFYTPLHHLMETIQYGPSLRVDKRVAMQLAPYLPVPMFFHFSELPYFENENIRTRFERRLRDELGNEEYASYARKLGLELLVNRDRHGGSGVYSYDWDTRGWMPTWDDPSWGGTINDDNGMWHPIIKGLSYIERNSDWPYFATRAPGLLYYSWITSAIKAVDYKEAQVNPWESQELEALDDSAFLNEEERAVGVQARIIMPFGSE